MATATTETKTMLGAINQALFEEMARDENVVVLGEDVGLNGGVFRATEGLQAQFGEDRVLDSPLSETGIVGSAIGMAIYGLKPVAEIQFADYIYPAFDQIVSELAKMRYRSGGEFTSPVVIRTPYGGGIRGGHYHSQSPEAYFCHTPGLQVVIPSTPADARGLLKSAIRGNDPVIFFEPKKLYRSTKQAVATDPEAALVPIGPCHVVQPGTDVSIFCYGAMVEVVQRAANKAASDDGVSVEIVDLRTLCPLDVAGIVASVQKTGRAIVVHEAPKTCGYGAEISATLAEKAIEYLEAPVVRVAGLDTPFPFTLEYVYMPHPARVYRAIQDVMAF
ncbi:MAG: alpha-ketoacid dehydrogenase subunit beta [Cyanobacteria bacterium HKST-UBA04]|nr:alpha-ketoacid dehydrogenase subunit beta [Cyanobacteria bacterium HKST-UBA04]